MTPLRRRSGARPRNRGGRHAHAHAPGGGRGNAFTRNALDGAVHRPDLCGLRPASRRRLRSGRALRPRIERARGIALGPCRLMRRFNSRRPMGLAAGTAGHGRRRPDRPRQIWWLGTVLATGVGACASGYRARPRHGGSGRRAAGSARMSSAHRIWTSSMESRRPKLAGEFARARLASALPPGPCSAGSAGRLWASNAV